MAIDIPTRLDMKNLCADIHFLSRIPHSLEGKTVVHVGVGDGSNCIVLSNLLPRTDFVVYTTEFKFHKNKPSNLCFVGKTFSKKEADFWQNGQSKKIIFICSGCQLYGGDTTMSLQKDWLESILKPEFWSICFRVSITNRSEQTFPYFAGKIWALPYGLPSSMRLDNLKDIFEPPFPHTCDHIWNVADIDASLATDRLKARCPYDFNTSFFLDALRFYCKKTSSNLTSEDDFIDLGKFIVQELKSLS